MIREFPVRKNLLQVNRQNIFQDLAILTQNPQKTLNIILAPSLLCFSIVYSQATGPGVA